MKLSKIFKKLPSPFRKEDLLLAVLSKECGNFGCGSPKRGSLFCSWLKSVCRKGEGCTEKEEEKLRQQEGELAKIRSEWREMLESGRSR